MKASQQSPPSAQRMVTRSSPRKFGNTQTELVHPAPPYARGGAIDVVAPAPPVRVNAFAALMGSKSRGRLGGPKKKAATTGKKNSNKKKKKK